MRMIIFALLLAISYAQTDGKLPHIVMVMVDDVGFGDTGYNGAEFPTPTLDKLYNQGTQLTNYRVHATCTPTRASLITGRYGFNIGLSAHLLSAAMVGLPADMATIPKLLKSRGYATHMVGKWHIGHAKWSHIPTGQGFDTWVGTFGCGNGHFSHYMGFDWQGAFDYMRVYENKTWEHQVDGRYSSEAFADESIQVIENHDKSKPMFLYLSFQSAHAPVQVPPYYLKNCQNIKNPLRKGFCGQMQSIDAAMLKVTQKIEEQLGDNVILFFSSDNGAWLVNGGLNRPWRGEKSSSYQGATSVPGFIVDYSGKYAAKGEYNGLIHVSDIFPTVSSWVGGKCPADLDGIDQSEALKTLGESPRDHVVLMYEQLKNIYSLQKGKYKLVSSRFDISSNLWLEWGEDGPIVDGGEPTKDLIGGSLMLKLWYSIFGLNFDQSWLFPEYTRHIYAVFSRAFAGEAAMTREIAFDHFFVKRNNDFGALMSQHDPVTHLFDLEADPTESNDLVDEMPEVVEELMALLQHYKDNEPPIEGWEKQHTGSKPYIYMPIENCGEDKMPSYIGQDIYTYTIFDTWMWYFGIVKCRFLHPWLEEDEIVPESKTMGVAGQLENTLLPFILTTLITIITSTCTCLYCGCKFTVSKLIKRN